MSHQGYLLLSYYTRIMKSMVDVRGKYEDVRK